MARFENLCFTERYAKIDPKSLVSPLSVISAAKNVVFLNFELVTLKI